MGFTHGRLGFRQSVLRYQCVVRAIWTPVISNRLISVTRALIAMYQSCLCVCVTARVLEMIMGMGFPFPLGNRNPTEMGIGYIGNGMGMGNGTDHVGMGGNGNVKSHSRIPIISNVYYYFAAIYFFTVFRKWEQCRHLANRQVFHHRSTLVMRRRFHGRVVARQPSDIANDQQLG